MARTVIAACLVVALAYGMYHRLETAGVFLETAPKNDGACQLLTGDSQFFGSEDIVQVVRGPHTGVGFVQGEDRRGWLPQDKSFLPPLFHEFDIGTAMTQSKYPTGALYMLDLRKGASQSPVRLALEGYTRWNFHPHGMEVVHPDGDESRVQLYVVNHLPARDEVAVFEIDFESQQAVYQMSMAHTLLRHHVVNNIAVSADGQHMYVSLWLYYPITTVGGWAEIYLGFKWGTLVHCTKPGTPDYECTLVEDHMAMPNGITLSADGTLLYVACMSDVHVYDVNSGDGTLTFAREVHVANTSTMDNLSLDPVSGDVITASHPKIMKIAAHTKSAEDLAPTQIIRIFDPALRGEPLSGPASSEEIFHDGDVLPCGTGAVLAYGRYFIGPLFSKGVLVCPDPSSSADVE